MKQWIRFRKPMDFHAHLRDGEMMKHVCRDTFPYFTRVLAMPNLKPEIVTAGDLLNYQDRILRAMSGIKPLMTFCITDKTTPEMIKPLRDAGAIAGKFYPAGVTNAAGSASELKAFYPIFEEMQAQKLTLCLHGEKPGIDPQTAEQEFLSELYQLVVDFPELPKVLEHVSSAAGIEMVSRLRNNVAATITVHHLFLTHSEEKPMVIDSPHHFCKPEAKTKADRDALRNAVLSGNPKFFLGTDSAPHPINDKESGLPLFKPKPGCYTAPVAIPLLVGFMEEAGRLDLLEKFSSEFGATFYNISLDDEEIEMVKKPWFVPYGMYAVQPFMAGEKIAWQLAT